MAITIQEERTLEKNEEGYKWHSLYEAQVNEEEFKKNLDFFQSRVRLLKEEIKNTNPEDLVKAKEIFLQEQRTIKEHALRNFDQYWKEEISAMEKRAVEEKEILKTFVEKYQEVKEAMLNNVREEAKARLESYNIQLEDAEKNLKVYENAEKEFNN